jgi:hypothetical protein
MGGDARFEPREMYRALSRHGVEYVTVGGVAVQAHGGQRTTRDLDVVVEASSENMQRLAAALLDLDARVLREDGQRSKSVPSAQLLRSSDLWHLITSHGRLDIATLPAHLGTFADVRARAHEVPLAEIAVPIAHRSDLMIMKRAAARPHDWVDLRLLESLDEEQ